MVLRHVSILRDHPQGVCLYLAKVTDSPTHGTTRVTKHTYYSIAATTPELTLNLPTTTIVAQPFNVIKWQLKFNPVA